MKYKIVDIEWQDGSHHYEAYFKQNWISRYNPINPEYPWHSWPQTFNSFSEVERAINMHFMLMKNKIEKERELQIKKVTTTYYNVNLNDDSPFSSK